MRGQSQECAAFFSLPCLSVFFSELSGTFTRFEGLCLREAQVGTTVGLSRWRRVVCLRRWCRDAIARAVGPLPNYRRWRDFKVCCMRDTTPAYYYYRMRDTLLAKIVWRIEKSFWRLVVSLAKCFSISRARLFRV